jgi:hypothetical protein
MQWTNLRQAFYSPASEGGSVDPIFAFVEGSALAAWVRGEVTDSTYVFPVIVTLHTLGMGFLAGGSAAIDLRILGIAPQVPIKPMARFLPLIWLAFAVMVVSGVLLLIAYPTKALTNPMFYLKLCLIALAVWLVRHVAAAVLRSPSVDDEPISSKAKALAIASLVSWIALITAGRLLAYTHKWEMLGVPALT